MSKTINQLCNLVDYQLEKNNKKTAPLDIIYDRISEKAAAWMNGNAPNLNTWQTRFNNLFSVNDYLAITHQMSNSPQDYVTFKVPLSSYEAAMHSIRLDALSTEISASLNLKQLAWRALSDLHLGDLAYKNDIDHTLITDKLTLDQIDTTWGDLHSTNFDDLHLKNLAFVAQISDSNVSDDPRAAIDNRKIAGLGNLATMDVTELNLQHLSHRPHVDLALHQDDVRSGTDYDLIGRLDWKHIKNAPEYKLPYAKPEELGGIKTGFNSNNGLYGVHLSSNQKAYVNVPWSDSYINIKNLAAAPTTVNTFKIVLDYEIYNKTPTNLMPLPDKRSYVQSVTIKPYIAKNVVVQNETVCNDVTLGDSIAVFSTGHESGAVKVKNGPKIQSNRHTEEYLRIDGTWTTIPEATQQKAGLLPAADKVVIDNLRAKKDYTLPAATPTTLGGIKLPNYAVANVASFNSYDREEVVSLPLRVTVDNVAYVNIPKSVGNTTEFSNVTQKTAEDTVDNKLNQLYPKGAIYITTAASCPLATLITGSVWEKVEGYYLLASGKLSGTDETYTAEEGKQVTVAAGLPNHTHSIPVGFGSCSCSNWGGSVKNYHGAGSNYSIVGGMAGFTKSKTVRPPAFIVNVFMRTK